MKRLFEAERGWDILGINEGVEPRHWACIPNKSLLITETYFISTIIQPEAVPCMATYDPK